MCSIVVSLLQTYFWSTQGKHQLLKSFLSIFSLHNALHIWHSIARAGITAIILFIIIIICWLILFTLSMSYSCSSCSKCISSLCPEYIAVLSQYLYVDSVIRFDGQRNKQQKGWEALKGQGEVMRWPLKASHLHPNYPPTAGSAL